jgi:hypothetical protein
MFSEVFVVGTRFPNLASAARSAPGQFLYDRRLRNWSGTPVSGEAGAPDDRRLADPVHVGLER